MQGRDGGVEDPAAVPDAEEGAGGRVVEEPARALDQVGHERTALYAFQGVRTEAVLDHEPRGDVRR